MPVPNAAAATLQVSSPAHNKIHVGPVHHMLTMYFFVYVVAVLIISIIHSEGFPALFVSQYH